MAGGGDYHPVKIDPALERWQAMHSSMYERFRFTPSKTRTVLIWALAVPALTGWIAIQSDNKWDWRSKTRSDSLLMHPPPAPQGGEEEEKKKKK